MNGILKIAGSAALLAAVCIFALSSSVPVRADGVVAVASAAIAVQVPVIASEITDTAKKNHEDEVPAAVDKEVLKAVTPVSLMRSITSTEKVKSRLIVDKDETLCVQSGGVLYLDTGSKLTLTGRLIVEEGGELYIRGSLDAREGSDITVNGKVKILSSGKIELGGKLNVTSDGIVKGNGAVDVLNNFSDIRCKGTLDVKLNAPKPVKKDGVTYVGGVLLVNKKYSLPKSYGDGLNPSAYSAFLKMKEASGFDMSIISGYRSYEKQQQTFNYWCDLDGYDKAVTYSAKPGHSEHQTGLAIDVTSLEEEYGETAEGRWLAENCYKYGFIIRYPKDKTHITGYVYEPWHIRYVGVSTAKLIHDSGLTLEEFLGVA